MIFLEMSKIMYMLEFPWTSYCLIIFGDTEFLQLQLRCIKQEFDYHEFLQLQSFQYWEFFSLNLRCIKQEFSHHFRHLLRPKPDDLWQPCWSCGKEKVRHWTLVVYFLLQFAIGPSRLFCLSCGKIEVNLPLFGWFFTFCLETISFGLLLSFSGWRWRWKVYDFLHSAWKQFHMALSFHFVDVDVWDLYIFRHSTIINSCRYWF